MKHIITMYGTMMVYLLSVFTCVTFMNAASVMTEAKEFKAQVIAEIENSNFNPYVIDGCIRQAEEAGYELQVTHCMYDENYDIQTAEVILVYQYRLPMFGIIQTKTTRGIAR